VANGNGWTKWLVGTLWSILVMVIMFTGNVVRGNDLQNRADHERIEEHSQKRHAEQEKKIDKVEEIVTDIRIEQKVIARDIKYIKSKLR